MLFKELIVSNFKSIGEEQVFTMEACPKSEIGEFEDHVLNIGDNRILKLSSIYGSNGSGKSNLLEAFDVFRDVVLNRDIVVDSISEYSYLNNNFKDDKVSSFSIFFVNDNYEIGYKVEVDISKNEEREVFNNKKNIVCKDIKYEECSIRRINSDEFISIYVRDEDSIIQSDIDEINKLDIVKSEFCKLDKSITFLHYLNDTFSKDSLNSSEIFSVLSNLYESFFKIVYIDSSKFNYVFDKNEIDIYEPMLERVTRYLNTLDFNVDHLAFRKNLTDEFYSIYVYRDLNGSVKEIPLKYESNGIKKLISYFFLLLDENYKLYLMDDFDSLLHCKIVNVMIDLFNDDSNKDKQFILSSNDITNMNNSNYRRDEIWFVNKDDDLESNYFSLSQIRNYKGEQIRKDAKYGKQYLEGRYGSIPFINDKLKWNK